MDCKHPVMYSRNCVLYCQVCGAVLPLETLTKPKEEPKLEPRPTPKRGKKPKAD